MAGSDAGGFGAGAVATGGGAGGGSMVRRLYHQYAAAAAASTTAISKVLARLLMTPLRRTRILRRLQPRGSPDHDDACSLKQCSTQLRAAEPAARLLPP